jgi:hypothetical protein
MRCDYCRQDITPGLGICPHCSQVQKTPSERSQSQRTRFFVMAAAAFILVIWHFLKP